MRQSRRSRSVLVGATLTLAALTVQARAEDIHFRDVTSELGIDWQRAVSADYAISQQIQQASLQEPVSLDLLPFIPMMPRGLPGVAIFDVDGDTDLDVFVPNGPGRDSSLFVNQLEETGELSFLDRAASAGLAATEMDGQGACAGDLDNDGDVDLLVLGRTQSNRLYENLGDGTFLEVAGSGLGADALSHISCSFGDIDGDGLLDIAVSNTFDPVSLEAIFIVPYALNQLNQLYHNDGGLQFSDVSVTSGIQDSDQLPPGAAGITWAVAMVDIDQDGDTDIVWADDQGGYPTVLLDPGAGVDRGLIHVAYNDGTGRFTDVALANSTTSASSWMGLGFGDLDCDGALDIFGSNFGDYNIPSLGFPYFLGLQATRYYLALGGGAYSESVPAEGTAFGWGNAVFDADNDGDADVVYHGGLEMTLIGLRDNPGVLLENQGCTPGEPTLVTTVTPFDGRHLERNVRGVAIGDLDRDGFVDMVTTANWRVPSQLPLIPSPASYGGILDDFASFVPVFVPVAPGELVWSGVELEDGDLSIELNDGNGNSGVTIAPLGGTDLTAGATVNRSGIGALIAFTPKGPGQTTALMPITGGSSHVSSHAPEAYFGLGERPWGTVDVLWPGGIRNRVFRVRRNERLTLPEIPCSIDTNQSFPAYFHCVRSALKDYVTEGVLGKKQAARLFVSALVAYHQEH